MLMACWGLCFDLRLNGQMYVTPVDIDEEKVEILKNIRPFKVFLACLMW